MTDSVSLISVARLTEMVREEAGISSQEMADIPIMTRLDVSREIRWQIGESPPGSNKHYVFAMFEGDAPYDVVVYVLPREPVPTHERHWQRFTLNRSFSPALVEAMNQKAFVEAVAGEFWSLLHGDDDDDEEEIECPACNADNNIDSDFCSSCGKALPDPTLEPPKPAVLQALPKPPADPS